MRALIIAASLVLVSCGYEESDTVIILQPVPISSPQPDVEPAQKVTVCQVLLTDARGNISRLTKYDTFTRDTYLAAEFTPEQAVEYVRLKHGKVTGSVSKLCYEKELAK